MPGGGLGSHSNWLQGLDSPLIQEDAANMGQKELKLRFDVSQYTPEEIMVKTVDNKLLVIKKLIYFLSINFRYRFTLMGFKKHHINIVRLGTCKT